MTSLRQHRIGIFGTSRRAATAALAMALALTVVPIQAAHAQTFQVIHKFTGGVDGSNPLAGLTIDRAGNLYGTARVGGNGGLGTVFEMKHKHSTWAFNPLYDFIPHSGDGLATQARVILGPHGLLYGTTSAGGNRGFGTVYKLIPPVNPCAGPLCLWADSLLYQFGQGRDGDGSVPSNGDVVFDQAGNLYGTTSIGGISDQGVVYKLSPSGQGWTESVIYRFDGSSGSSPQSGVIFDSAGKLYGTTDAGGTGFGTVYQLTPSGSDWLEHTICTFQGSDGGSPMGGLIIDGSGNLYGTTWRPATVFKLTPSQGTCNKEILYTFSGSAGPTGSLAMDAAGNLYGTTQRNNGHTLGEVFKLSKSGNTWTYVDLHDFNGGSDDGSTPYGGVVLDASGNIYGTTAYGGNGDQGVVWEITP